MTALLQRLMEFPNKSVSEFFLPLPPLGTCNNNTADDCMLPNGNIAENCETMADHWQVVDPSKPQCSPGLVPTGSPSTTPTQPCKESSICELLLGR